VPVLVTGIFHVVGLIRSCDAKKVAGEKCQWHFARQPSLANWFAMMKLRARRMWASPAPATKQNAPPCVGLFACLEIDSSPKGSIIAVG